MRLCHAGAGVLQQVHLAPISITVSMLLLASAASLTPSGAEASPWPFTRTAELVNGRAAMIGFVALLATEALKGGPFIGS